MIALRDAEASWLCQRHITTMAMLAARLPNIYPTIDELAASTKMSVRSVMTSLAELKANGLIGYDTTPGKRHVYIIHLAALVALTPPEKARAPRAVVAPPLRGGPPTYPESGPRYTRPGSGLQPLGKLKVVK